MAGSLKLFYAVPTGLRTVIGDRFSIHIPIPNGIPATRSVLALSGFRVTTGVLRGPTSMLAKRSYNRTGVTLIELLCVMAIIGILASLMLPALSKGLRKARGLAGHLGGSGGIQLRIGEVATNYTRYRAANPNHLKLSRSAFASELHLSPTAEAWLNLGSVEYRPFAAIDPQDQPAIVVHASEGGGSGERNVVFCIRDLIRP